MERTLQHVPLSEIGDSIGTPPSQRLRESVSRIGVIQPVMLTERPDDSGEIHLPIVDGNRRIAAARAANLNDIPAVIVDNMEPNIIAETTLATNSFRSANYLAEFWALKQLERNQYQYEDLVTASGMAWSTIKHRRALSNLNRDLFVALRNGQIDQSTASAIAKLPPHSQQALAEKFERFGKLGRRDIQSLTGPSSQTETDGDKIAAQLAETAVSAKKAGYNRDEFLELAARKWDEVNSQ